MRSTAAAPANAFLMDALIKEFWKLRSRTSTEGGEKRIAMAGTTWLVVVVTGQFLQKTENPPVCDTTKGRPFRRSEQCS